MDEAFGVHPAQGVFADAELAGAVGHDDGLAEQALLANGAPQSALAGEANWIGGDPEIGESERVQMAHPVFARRKPPRRMAGELVDEGEATQWEAAWRGGP